MSIVFYTGRSGSGKIYVSYFIVLLFLGLFFASDVLALEPLQQVVNDAISGTDVDTSYVTQDLYSGLSGTSVSASISWRCETLNVGYCARPGMYITKYPTEADMLANTGSLGTTTSSAVDSQTVVGSYISKVTFASLVFDSSKFYKIRYYCVSGCLADARIRGTTSNVFSRSSVYRGSTPGTPDSVIEDSYFAIHSAYYEGEPPGEEPSTLPWANIFSDRSGWTWVYPVDNTLTSSKSIDFELQYYFDTRYHASSSFSKYLIYACELGGYNSGQPFDFDSADGCNYFTGDLSDYDVSVDLNFTGWVSTSARHIGYAGFWNGVSEVTECSWWQFWCGASSPQFFSGETVLFDVYKTSISWEDIVVPGSKAGVQGLCGASDVPWYDVNELVPAYLCEVTVWFFYPNADITKSSFESMKNQLMVKAPFGYIASSFFEIYNLTGTEASSSPGVIEYSFLGTDIEFINYQKIRSQFGELIDEVGSWIVVFGWVAFAFIVLRLIFKIPGISIFDDTYVADPHIPSRTMKMGKYNVKK